MVGLSEYATAPLTALTPTHQGCPSHGVVTRGFLSGSFLAGHGEGYSACRIGALCLLSRRGGKEPDSRAECLRGSAFNLPQMEPPLCHVSATPRGPEALKPGIRARPCPCLWPEACLEPFGPLSFLETGLLGVSVSLPLRQYPSVPECRFLPRGCDTDRSLGLFSLRAALTVGLLADQHSAAAPERLPVTAGP